MTYLNKKIIRNIFIFSIFLFCLLYFFNLSIAKYRKVVEGNVDAQIASWRIKVNDEDIKNKKTLTQKIIPVFPGDEYTKPNVLAPGSIGYFDLIIDTSAVEVNLNYEITVNNSPSSSIADLKVTSYTLNPATREEQIPYEGLISDVIQYNNEKTTIRVYIEWDDNEETSTMTNEDDTNVAVNDASKAIIDVNLKFNQINKKRAGT